jgi:hypothetical protein
MFISIPRGGRQEPALMKVVLLYRRITGVNGPSSVVVRGPSLTHKRHAVSRDDIAEFREGSRLPNCSY